MVCLNKDFYYVLKNIVHDDDKPSMYTKSSWVVGKKKMILESNFVPDHFVFDYLQKMLWKNEDFKKENEGFLYEYQDELEERMFSQMTKQKE